jgi:hypothetical protein
MNDLPVACTLSVHDVHCAADDLLPGLARIAQGVTRQADGARLVFEPSDGIVARIADVIERERRCCRFLRFALEVREGGGEVALTISGPAGTGAFLESLSAEFRYRATA